MSKKIFLTGDRPTGNLHIGHYVGSLLNRIEIQKEENNKLFVFIADLQALTDNFDDPKKISKNVLDLAIDYLSVGIDPSKTTIFIQSKIPELSELTMLYMNLISVNRLKRNPTIKEEIKQRGFDKVLPLGFLAYPVSQAADITAFNANYVPVGEDQMPVIENAREIVRKFNTTYKKTLVLPQGVLPKKKQAARLPGIDGNSKMSKSLNNCIFLSDSKEEVEKKVMKMYTDPNHLRVEDPGVVKGNTVFTYLDIFCRNDHFAKYLPQYKNLDKLKEHYQKGGLGDVKIKKFLNNILQEELAPIRKKREYYLDRKKEVAQILIDGTKEAKKVASQTLNDVKKAIGINYFGE